ncbi:hypothetical protein HNR44_000042 [Geomicrobium halophilum]|uniref:Uncharacterized protein n=1 Tax=Geomicrobium halophilum TaxID=549000 RepID=A0A841PV99_9BACL|nr:hypothetical protein [Geomicrobium halophilum]MBB6448093.1 hypothetical protein [Geomicrobium halophilum]
MGKNRGSNKSNNQEKDEEELIRMSEDFVYYGAVLNTLASVLTLIGLDIAREVDRREDSAEAEEVATGFAADFEGSDGNVDLPNHLYTNIKQMRNELDRVNWKVKILQEQLDKWNQPPY